MSGYPLPVLPVLLALAQPVTLHVDAATNVAPAQQNGSEAAPYSTVTAAVAGASARGITVAVFELAPSSAYAGESPVTIPQATFYMFEAPVRRCTFPGFNWSLSGAAGVSALVLRGLTVAGPVVITDGTSPATEARAVFENCAFLSTLTKTGTSTLTANIIGSSLVAMRLNDNPAVSSQIAGNVSLSETTVFMQHTQLTAGCTSFACRELHVDLCTLFANITLSGTIGEVHRSFWKTAGRTITFSGAPGTVDVGTQSYGSMLAMGTTVVNGTLLTAEAVVSGAVATLGYTAAAPVTQTVLPANHPPGLYQINRQLMRRAAGDVGSVLTASHNWTDPNQGAQSAASAALSLVGTGVVALAANNNVVFSNGVGAITVTWTPALIAGTPLMDLYSSAVRVG